MFRPADLLDLAQCPFPELFDGCAYAWEVLPKLAGFLTAHVKPGQFGVVTGTPYIGAQVSIGKGTTIEHGAVINGPAIIGANCQIRASAYLRENVVIGDGCVLGNASEFKNCLLFHGVQ